LYEVLTIDALSPSQWEALAGKLVLAVYLGFGQYSWCLPVLCCHSHLHSHC